MDHCVFFTVKCILKYGVIKVRGIDKEEKKNDDFPSMLDLWMLYPQAWKHKGKHLRHSSHYSERLGIQTDLESLMYNTQVLLA